MWLRLESNPNRCEVFINWLTPLKYLSTKFFSVVGSLLYSRQRHTPTSKRQTTMETINGWTDKTDFLLSHPFGITSPSTGISSSRRSSPDDNVAVADGSHDDEDSHHHQQQQHPQKNCNGCSDSDYRHNKHHGGYDIIDHAFGYTFPSGLRKELQSNGWIGDDVQGVRGKLSQARTKMDVDMDKFLNSFLGSNDFVVQSSSKRDHIRGDESAFFPREERLKDDFPTRYPLFDQLVRSIERTAMDRLGTTTASSSSKYFEFDPSKTSVQIARYPGDGQAGYPRHCDRGAACLNEQEHGQAPTLASTERLLTFVYYLTPCDWDAELDGGALRVYSSDNNRREHEKMNETESYFDITPFADRLVVFRSDCVEHEVMASLRRERIAVTVWLYGRVVRLDESVGEEVVMPSYSEKTKSTTIHTSNLHLPPTLPLPENTYDNDGNRETMFIAIPSYRDDETWPTIRSLLQTAVLPERISIGVVWQVDTSSREEVQFLTDGEEYLNDISWNSYTNFRSLTMDFRQATGEYNNVLFVLILHCYYCCVQLAFVLHLRPLLRSISGAILA